jgi:hypothetical protein
MHFQDHYSGDWDALYAQHVYPGHENWYHAQNPSYFGHNRPSRRKYGPYMIPSDPYLYSAWQYQQQQQQQQEQSDYYARAFHQHHHQHPSHHQKHYSTSHRSRISTNVAAAG